MSAMSAGFHAETIRRRPTERGGIGLDRLDPRDQVGDLVDRLAIGCPPRTPLLAIDRTQLPLRVGPLVPDRDPVFLEIGDIRRAPKEPDQLVNDGTERQALGRDQRESLAKVKSDLPAEDAEGLDLLPRRAQHGPGRLPHAMGADVAEQGKVLFHPGGFWVRLKRNRTRHRLVLYAPRSLPFGSCSQRNKRGVSRVMGWSDRTRTLI